MDKLHGISDALELAVFFLEVWAFPRRNVTVFAHIEYSAAPHTKASVLACSGASWMLPSES